MDQPRSKQVSQFTKWGFVLGLSALYFLALLGLHRISGTAAVTLGIFPAALAGWYFGIWGGGIASLALGAVGSLILYKLTGSAALGKIWPEILLILWTGLATGYLHVIQGDRSRAEVKLQKQLREANALAGISHTLSETERVGLDHVLQLIVDSARELLAGTERAVIHLLDEEDQILIARAVSGIQAPEERRVNMRLGEGVAGQVIASNRPINITNVATDERFLRQDTRPRFQSLMVAPLQSGEKRLGTISVQSGRTDAFSGEEMQLLTSLGAQASIAIENARLWEDTQQGLRETNSLYHITRGLSASLDPDELMKEVVSLLQKNFGYYYTAIFIIDPVTEDLTVRHDCMDQKELLKDGRLAAGTGIVGHVAITGEPFLTNDVDQVLFYYHHPSLPRTQSELSMPIKVNERVIGVLDVQQSAPRRLTSRDLQLLGTVAEQLAISLQKANLYSELQASLQQEKAMRSQLIQSERLALVGRLLASVSHELNNPLQAIQNALFLLKEERGISAQGQQDLEIILSESERMAALIDRLRSTYRPTRIEDFRTIQLNPLVEEVHNLVAAHLRHHEIAFEFHPDPNLPPVLGLPDQLKQVTLNLVMNAVEAMKGGGKLTVTTRCNNAGEAVLTVANTGPHIAPEILPHIFDAFVTDKESGTGLGLTITYDIVQRHHGRIIAENNPHGGVIFTVWLPIHNREAA